MTLLNKYCGDGGIYQLSCMKRLLLLSLSLTCFIFSSNAQWTLFNTSNSLLPGNEIYCLAKDTTGNLWIGTDYGLVKYDGAAFTIIDSSNSDLPVNEIRSIAFDKTGKMWVGTLQAGFSIFNGSSWTSFNSQNSLLPDNQVRTIGFDTAGIAWLGTSGGAVYQSDEGWIVYSIFNSPIGADNINDIHIDKNDVVWIGTVNGGISRKTGNVWNTYNNVNSGVSDNTINDLESDIFGNVWFATPAQGLGRFNGTTWFFRNNFNSGIPTNSLTCLEINERTNVKYLGTFDKGIIRWNNNFVFDSFTVSNSPMPENHVSSLLQFNDSVFYIGTLNSGLVKWIDTTEYATVSGTTEDWSNDVRLLVYPNPADAVLTIELNKEYSGLHYQIFSLEGVLLQGAVMPDKKRLIQIDASDLSTGCYILTLQTDHTVSSSRFMVTH